MKTGPILWILLETIFCIKAQLPTFEDSINCGDTLIGETISKTESEHYYLFNIYNATIYLYADSCESEYDTIITLYDYNMNEIASDDGTNSNCDNYQAQLFYGPITLNGMYIIKISGYRSAFGNYTVEMNCYSTISQTYYLSKNGIDHPLCGSINNPCGSLFQASSNLNNVTNEIIQQIPPTIYVIDGQNQSEIQRHLIMDDTNGYDPCLPLPFINSRDITIEFDSTQITNMNQWLPINICNGSYYLYHNDFLFDGGKSLIINNLIITNYSNYPFIRSIDYFDASITCNYCIFKNIYTQSSDSLIDSRSSIYLSNTEFINIQVSIAESIIYSHPDDYETSAERNLMLIDTVFRNIKSYGIVVIGRSLSDVECCFCFYLFMKSSENVSNVSFFFCLYTDF